MPTPAVPRDLPAVYARDLLDRNLAALDRTDPELAERVRLPMASEHVRCDSKGSLSLRLHRAWVCLDLGESELESRFADLDGVPSVLLFGIGRGELVEGLLDRTSVLRIVAWERDPWLLRLFLMRRDLTDELASGRLRFALGIDLLRQIGTSATPIEHPVLGGVYAGEIRMARDGLHPRRAMLCAGGLFVEEVRHGLEAKGFSPWTLDIQALAREELDRSMARFRPELVFSINYTEGVAEFSQAHGVKLVCWEVDPATSPVRPLSGAVDHAFVFVHRRANVAEFRRAGFVNVEYLPLAADPNLRREITLPPDEKEALAAPLAFVGASMVANAAECHERFLEAHLAWHGDENGDVGETLAESILERQAEDLSAFLVPELLAAQAPGFRAAARDDGEDPALLLGEIAASRKRMAYARGLGDLGLSIWGDAGWENVVEDGVRYRGAAGHRHELTRIYNASPLHWDVGRIYQPDIVTMRVFDVLSCGRLVIAEHNAALEELFEVGLEVESYRDLAELRAKVAHYGDHPADAQRIAHRGQAAIHARHTIAHRIEHMLHRVGNGR